MAITYNEDGSVRKRKGDKKAIAMGKEFFGVPKDVREANKRLSGKGPFDINDSKTSKNGLVNDAAEAPLNLLKFIKANKKKKDMLEKVKKEAGGY